MMGASLLCLEVGEGRSVQWMLLLLRLLSLALLPVVWLCCRSPPPRLFAPVALSDVDGMILYWGKTYQDKTTTCNYFYCLHNQLTMLIS